MARLRLTERADKDIDKLARPVKGAMWDFMRKFRQDPSSPGLRFKQLKGDSRLYSARVSDDYRAIMLHLKDDEYMLVTVKHRSESYDHMDRYAHQINQVTGGIDFYDMASLDGTVKPPAPTGPPPLFAGYSESQLTGLGVGRPLLSTIGKITTEEQLLEFAECVPQLTADVLLALHDGASVEEVMEQVTAPVSATEPVDPTDYAAAADRPASLVTTDDETLQAILAGGFERWQVYLHPVQRRVVERSYSGPARVSGGPGTGKTIVALHRVRWLVQHLPSDSTGRDVLFTTFNRSLAGDLRKRLLLLGGPELLDRVDVVNIDQLATRIVNEAQSGARLPLMNEGKAIELWNEMLLELGETRWDAGFLYDEWSQVVLGHAITSRQEYFRARRAGRGRQLNRAQRAAIWELVEQFTKRLDEANLWTFARVAAHAARLERELAATRAPRYRHIVVDEAQDLSSAHWMLLRAMVGQGTERPVPRGRHPPADLRQLRVPEQPRHRDPGPFVTADPHLPKHSRDPHRRVTDPRHRIVGRHGRRDRHPGRVPVRAPRPAAGVPRVRKLAGRTRRHPAPGAGVDRRRHVHRGIRAHQETGRPGRELPVRSRRARRVDRPGRAASARRSARRDPAAVQGPGIPADDPRRDHRRGRPRPARHRRPGPSASRADAGTVAPVRRGHPGTRRAGDLLERAAQPFPPPGAVRSVLDRYGAVAS